MKTKKEKYESTMYALRNCLHQGSLERDWLQDIEIYVLSLEKMSMLDESYLIEQQAIELQKRQTEIDLLRNEIDWEQEVKKALKSKLELSNGRLNDAKQLLESWQSQDPEHHYDDFDPDSMGCITRAFLEKLK